MRVVQLQRDDEDGLGFLISEGETGGMVTVTTIVPGGPADVVGLLHMYSPHTQKQKQSKKAVFRCRLTVTQSGIARMPGLGTRRWTDRTSSARGVGTQSPTWTTAGMRELPVTLPPRNKFPGTHSQLSELVGWY